MQPATCLNPSGYDHDTRILLIFFLIENHMVTMAKFCVAQSHHLSGAINDFPAACTNRSSTEEHSEHNHCLSLPQHFQDNFLAMEEEVMTRRYVIFFALFCFISFYLCHFRQVI